MQVINIRLVLEKDDGGVRQSERQYIPELKRQGIDVVGVVLGQTFGNYTDQIDDFSILINWSPSKYSKGFLSRITGFLRDYFKAGAVAENILKKVSSPELFPDSSLIVINIRRITLLPIAVAMAKKLRGTVVYHSGSSFNKGPFCINHLVYWMLRKSRSVTMLANSKYSRDTYRLGAEDYVYPGVSHSRLVITSAPSSVRDKLKISQCAPVFLYLARVNWDKAPDVFLRAFIKSESVKNEGAHLIIAGPAQDERLSAELDALINSSDLRNNIHTVGKQKNVGDWYAASDVFVNSRRGPEPFGISIVEAMAAGLPILSSALGGPSETIQEGYNGWLVQDLSVDGYRNGIEAALSCRQQWRAFGKRSAEMAKAYSVEKQVERYLRYGLGVNPHMALGNRE